VYANAPTTVVAKMRIVPLYSVHTANEALALALKDLSQIHQVLSQVRLLGCAIGPPM